MLDVEDILENEYAEIETNRQNMICLLHMSNESDLYKVFSYLKAYEDKIFIPYLPRGSLQFIQTYQYLHKFATIRPIIAMYHSENLRTEVKLANSYVDKQLYVSSFEPGNTNKMKQTRKQIEPLWYENIAVEVMEEVTQSLLFTLVELVLTGISRFKIKL